MNTLQLPLYAQLKESIIAEIAAGDLQPQDRLPSHHALCEQHAVSYMTMRRAITELVQEGVLYALPGKGVYVAAPKEVAETHPLLGFTEDMAQRGKTASSCLLTAELCDASTLLAQALNVAPGTALVHLARLRLADHVPVAIQTTYLRHNLCPGILNHNMERGSLYDILRHEYFLELASSRGTVGAALATEEEAELLGVALPAALLVTEQITFLDTGEPIELTHTRYRADRYTMRLDS